MIKLKRKPLLDQLSVLFGSSITRGVAFLNNIIIARSLSVTDFGKFSLFYITMITVSTIPQAFDATFLRYAKNNDTNYSRDDFFRSILQLKIAFLLCVTLVSYPAINYFLASLFPNREITKILFIGTISGTFLCFINTISTLFQERENFIRYALAQGIFTTCIFITLLVFSQFNIFSINFAINIYLYTSILMGLICISILFATIHKPLRFDKRLVVKIVQFGKWALGTSIIFFIFPRIDTFILAKHVSYENIGIYSVAAQLTLIITVITGAMGVVYMPKSFSSIKSKTAFVSYIHECVIPVIVIILAIAFLMVFAFPIVKFVYGDAYINAVAPLRILLAGYISLSLYLPFSFVFFAVDHPHTRFYLEFSKAIFAIIIISILIPQFGIIGASIGMSTALVFNSLLSFIIIFRIIKNKFIINRCTHF